MRPFHTSLHASLPYISTCVPSIHLYMRPFHTSLHASLPYISTCVPSIHLYMRPFHTSLHASLQVLKTLPAFVIGLIVKICRVTSPKLVFLSMYDKLKLKNDATYVGIKWDFLRNFCSSLKNNKLFFLRKHPPPKKILDRG
jgi:uncharacterized integral membrane protein